MKSALQTSAHSASAREFWYGQAVHMAQLDCVLLGLLTDADREHLEKLGPDLYPVVLKKLDELVGDCCREEQRLTRRTKGALQRLDQALWNFLKAWNRSPDVPPYATRPQPAVSQPDSTDKGLT